MRVLTGRVWGLVWGLVGCAAGSGAGDAPVPGELDRWDFEDDRLEPAGFVSWRVGGGPAELTCGGEGWDCGAFHPTTAHLDEADPLAAPAAGLHAMYLNVQPFSETRPLPGFMTAELVVEDAAVDGATYTVTFAVAERLDLGAPELSVELVLDPGGAEEVLDAVTPRLVGSGRWAEVSLAGAPSVAGAPIALRLDLSNRNLNQEQVLVDRVIVAAE